jgi:hypothetical protein
MLAEAAEDLDKSLSNAGYFISQAPNQDPVATAEVSHAASQINAHKIAALYSFSSEQAMDLGIIPDTRPPAPKPSRRVRLGWWWEAHRPHLHFGPCPVEWED